MGVFSDWRGPLWLELGFVSAKMGGFLFVSLEDHTKMARRKKDTPM